MKTTRAMINVHDGVLTMEFDREVVKFNIFEAIRCVNDRRDELETPSDEFQCEEEKTETQRCSTKLLPLKKQKNCCFSTIVAANYHPMLVGVLQSTVD